METTVKIRFTQNIETKEAEPQTFEKGKTYDLVHTSADHWIRRGVAVLASAPVTDAEKDPARELPKNKAELKELHANAKHAEADDQATRKAAAKAAAHEAAVHDHEIADEHKKAARR